MSKRVLIVDDVAFIRKALKDIFQSAHYSVVGEATNGAEAVEKYAELRPDLVTMDIVMPKMSGIDATKTIMKADREAKIMIVSAMGQENLVTEAIQIGARDYILKPFTAADILKTADRILSQEEKTFTSHRGT